MHIISPSTFARINRPMWKMLIILIQDLLNRRYAEQEQRCLKHVDLFL